MMMSAEVKIFDEYVRYVLNGMYVGYLLLSVLYI